MSGVVVAHDDGSIVLGSCNLSGVVVAHDDGSIVLGSCNLSGVVVAHDGGSIVLGCCDLSGVVVAHDDGSIVLGDCDLSGVVVAYYGVFSIARRHDGRFAIEVSCVGIRPSTIVFHCGLDFTNGFRFHHRCFVLHRACERRVDLSEHLLLHRL